MRILALTNLYPPHSLGGYELICRTVLELLRARGHVARVLTSDHRVPSALESPEPEVERTLRIHGFYGHPWRGIAQLRSIERHNNDALRAALSRFGPDLVYVWNMGGLSKSMLLTLQASGIPVVVYMSDHWIARGLTSDVWLRWWNRADASPYQRTARAIWTAFGGRRRWQRVAPTNPPRHFKFQRIYFCSRALRELTQEAGFDVGHGAIIYCPVDVERFDGAPHPPERPLRNWLYVGRLAEDKGVMTALRALAKIKDRFSGRLNIYGRGDAAYESQLRRFVADNGLPVEFRSATPEEMPRVYRDHDALLFTSEWAEPFALTPLEAMASGLPVIGTATGGSAELFRHGENALVYRAGDAEELAKRWVELSEAPEARAKIAAAGRAEARKRCAAPVIVDQIERYLLETLEVWSPQPLPPFDAR